MPKVGQPSKIHGRPARRLQRGVAQAGLLARVAVSGLVLIVVGIYCRGMGWTTPEMLAPLGLDLAMVIVNIGVFLIFIGVLNSFFYAPFKASVDKRNEGLEVTFTEAENLKKEMAELRTSYEARLAKTEAEAREQIQAQIREAQQLRQTLMSEATARADELVKKAELEIEAEKQRALSQLRGHVVDLTLSATERLIGKNVDDSVNRKLVDEFIDNLAVAGA